MIRRQTIIKPAHTKIISVEKRTKAKKPGGSESLERYTYSYSHLGDSGVYYLYGGIDEQSTARAISFILEANLDPECTWDYMTLIVNSAGGYITDGFALIDVMFGSRIPIRTVGIGMIASMGLQIFLAGEQGNRMLTPNCMILSHQFAGGMYGKEHELVASQVEIENLSEIVIRHYKRTTGLSTADVKKYLLPAEDVWLTATQAKKYGICEIVKDLKPAKIKRIEKK